MIDEQHPMQIGIFPLDIKCQQQQQLQPTPTNNMLQNGNERMLQTMATSINGLAADKIGNGNMATAASTRNVNGSCNDNHNNSSLSNNNTNNNNNSNNVSNTNINNKTSNSNHPQQQQTHSCGPGPPVPPLHQSMTSVSGRVTLGECSLNGIASGHIGALCVNNSNNNNNHMNTNNHNGNVGGTYALQQQLQLAPPHTPPTIAMLQHPLTPISSVASTASGDAMHSLQLPPCVPTSGRGPINSAAILDQCGYCCQPICDRYIMRVVDTSFHEGCLKCATCSLHLVHSCFARDGKLFCRIDYERLYIRNRCLGCGHRIAADELVMRTANIENVFHLKCFSCVVCGALLKKGEQYVVKQGQLFCRFDYEKEVEMLQGYADFYGDDMFTPKMDGRRGPKRPRTILNTQQRRAFKASFEVSPKPCRKVRENLAKETGLSLRIVQVWFQNQRAKVKKIQKKAKQEPQTANAKGTSADSQDSQESQDSHLAKVKDEAHSDSESQLESPYSASSDSLAKIRCIKDEHENGTPFNCMETNKENCNKTNEPILNTILGLSYATFQQLMGPFTQSTPMINPIDRLYSMQNSYFRPDELGYSDCGKDTMEH